MSVFLDDEARAGGRIFKKHVPRCGDVGQVGLVFRCRMFAVVRIYPHFTGPLWRPAGTVICVVRNTDERLTDCRELSNSLSPVPSPARSVGLPPSPHHRRPCGSLCARSCTDTQVASVLLPQLVVVGGPRGRPSPSVPPTAVRLVLARRASACDAPLWIIY